MTDLFAIEQIPVILLNLPTHIRGFCCLGSDYEPCIILNARLSYEQRVRTYRHEIEPECYGYHGDGPGGGSRGQ